MRFDVGASESHVTTGMPASTALSIVLGQEVGVQHRDRDAVHLLRDERLEDLLLLELIGVVRAAVDHLDVAERRRLALGADLA